MSQTVYVQDPPVAIEGMIADSSPYLEIISRKVEQAAGIPFGRFVTKGTASDQIQLPNATGDVSSSAGVGFTRADTSREQAATPQGYQDDHIADVMRRGNMWVDPEGTPAYGAQVFVRFAAGAGGSDLGRTRIDADTATAVALPGCFFRESEGSFTKIEFNPQV